MMRDTRWGVGVLALVVGFSFATETPAQAGWPFSKKKARATATQVAVPTTYAAVPTAYSTVPTIDRNATAPTPMLGSFYPAPYMLVRGDYPTGGGYSPLGGYGDQNLVMYGPLSAYRATTAPVLMYSRGYDGRLIPTTATSFSYPNQPDASPVIYPTQATNYYGFRESGTPPWWKSAINWIDQN